MRNFRVILTLCWLILCIGGQRLGAAPETRYSVDVWGLDEGLPQSSIISMIQTRDGYLWLGTLNGLVRFDGVRFTVFDESNTLGLENSRIVNLFEDSHGVLWIGTESAGVAMAQDGRLTSLNIGRDRRQGRLVGICEDAVGAIWLYTADGELMRYNHGTNSWSMGASRLYRGLTVDKSGKIWVGTDQGLVVLNPKASLTPDSLPSEQVVAVGALQYVLGSQNGGCWRLADGVIQKWTGDQLDCDWGAYPWGNTPISTACEDRDGNLVVGTLGQGLFWFNADGKVTSLSTNEGLSNNYILSLRPDRDGSLWVGTDGGGLNRVKAQVFIPLADSLGTNVQSVAEDKEGGIWFTSFGIRSSRINCWKNGVLTQYASSGVPVNEMNLRAVWVDRQQNVWVTTLGTGVLKLQNGVFKPFGLGVIDSDVSTIFEDRSGNLWFGTRGGLARWDGGEWKVFTTEDGLSANMVSAIAESPNGSLWIGTERGGLNQFFNGQFIWYRKAEGFPSDSISAVLADRDGVVWVGTQGSGLIRVQNEKWHACTTENGMLGNGIHSLVEDDKGCLWIGSNRGVMRVNKKELNDFALGAIDFIPGRTFGRREGLPSTECSLGAQPAALKSQDGQLWFATIKGLASVDPAQFHFNTNTPSVMIEAVLLDGRRENAGGLRAISPTEIIVPPGKEILEIQYTSINLDGPDHGHFRCWMENYENGWRDAHNRRVAVYPKLPPGHYIFHVSACNDDGQWNPTGTTLNVIVQPPFWRTAWFLTLCALLMLGAIVGCVYYVSTQKLQRQLMEMKQHEALERERARISRDIHDQVGANLTQVALLGEMVEFDKDLPEEVEQHARQITQSARETSRALDEIVWTVNPSNDTLEGLVNYICKHAQEYLAVAELRYRLEVPPLPEASITPEARHNVFLAAKEAVTNVVKHAKATEVWIRLTLEESAFVLEIEDNGKGPAGMEDKAKQTRNGLRNMRKRMEDIGGEFSIGPRPEGGSRVRLKAPFKKS